MPWHKVMLMVVMMMMIHPAAHLQDGGGNLATLAHPRPCGTQIQMHGIRAAQALVPWSGLLVAYRVGES